MSSLDDRPFPTGALIGAGFLILTTVVGIGTIQLRKHFSHVPLIASDIQVTQPVQTRTLRFEDQKDGVAVYGGHVRVFDAATGTELPPLREREGFVRAVLNSLTYERTKNSVQAQPVFELTRWSDGKVTMADKATGAMINLGDFGHGNKSAFLRFLPAVTP